MVRPGQWTVRADGEEVGTFSLLDDVPSTGRALFPSVSAGHVATALNDLHRSLASDETVRWRAAGWAGAAEHDEALAAIRLFTAGLPTAVRSDLDAAWRRTGFTMPTTRTEMDEWTSTVEAIIATAPIVAVDDTFGYDEVA
jgi:hypothetical protein